MRRLFFSLLALSFVGTVLGCRHTHGVCDCEADDPCCTRAPWVQRGGAEPPTTMPMPETRETLPTTPMKK